LVESCWPFLYREAATAIGFESEEVGLRKLRERLQATIPDSELIEFGKAARKLCGLRGSGTGDPFKVQLEEARKEWRRRYPRLRNIRLATKSASTCTRVKLWAPSSKPSSITTHSVQYQVDFGFDQTALVHEWQIVKD